MALVSSSMGPMNSLLEKLAAKSELKDLRDGFLSIRKDLLLFSAHGAVRSLLVQRWMKQVRELAYDMEDWIDDLLIIRPAAGDSSSLSSSGVAAQIEEFKIQIHDVQDRCARYGLRGKSPPSVAADLMSSKVNIDTKLLLQEKPILVGLGGPKSEILQHLMDKDKRLKVVTIVGMGGLGKTTLASAVYRELQSQFDCRAFVTVGRDTSARTTLANILRQVMPSGRIKEDWDEGQVSTKLWEFLRRKRYLMVIDDIWSTRGWSSISCTFPDQNLESRILVTTCIDDVANTCCLQPNDFVYSMKALSYHDSMSLMANWISSREEYWPFCSKICGIILEICAGVPLAILIMSGLLAMKHAELSLYKMLEKVSAISIQNQDSTTQGMRKLLDICYADLPLPMKSCFLFLSAFPENYTIEKDRLIRRWIAEGLIPKIIGMRLWETAESYLNELISRRLVEPVFDFNDDEPVGCIVHCVIHDFIKMLSREENFITFGDDLYYGLYPCDRIRRFSVDSTDHNNGNTLAKSIMQLSGVRSFTVYGEVKGNPADLSGFKFVQVLDLTGCSRTNLFYHLVSVECLPLLRYLGLAGTCIDVLPERIVELEHLTTLDLRHNSVRHLPAFRSVKLVSLLGNAVELSRGMEMPELEELSTVKVDNTDSMATVAEIVHNSKQMRMLGVTFSSRYAEQQGMMHFLDEVGESRCLQSLCLEYRGVYLFTMLLDWWTKRKPCGLRKFELKFLGYKLSKIPQNMSSLVDLTHLHIIVEKDETEGLHILGKLPNLVSLTLISAPPTTTQETIIIAVKDRFRCLKVFCYDCLAGNVCLEFEAGSMRCLRRLHLNFNARAAKYLDGIQHLSCLVRVHFTVYCQGATDWDVKAATTAITYQASQISNNATWEISKEGEDVMEEDTRHCPSPSGNGSVGEGTTVITRPEHRESTEMDVVQQSHGFHTGFVRILEWIKDILDWGDKDTDSLYPISFIRPWALGHEREIGPEPYLGFRPWCQIQNESLYQ